MEPCSIHITSGRGTITSRTGRLPKSKTLWSISASSVSTVPSLCPTDIIVRISSSLTRDLGTGVPPASLLNPEAIQLSTTTKGVNNQDITSIGRANARDSLSARWAAMVLGVVSQNIRRRMVTPIVAISNPRSCPQTETAKIVARAVAAVFTKLLPSRMVDKSLAGR
ncbi:hypothetical protein ES703_119536 [subsurface metagenome]